MNSEKKTPAIPACIISLLCQIPLLMAFDLSPLIYMFGTPLSVQVFNTEVLTSAVNEAMSLLTDVQQMNTW